MLRCENVHKAYRLGRTVLPVLRGVSLNLSAGRFVAIMGASGSGKSTLLHVLSGLDVPQRGQVWFEDQPLFEPEEARSMPGERAAGQYADVSRPAGRRVAEAMAPAAAKSRAARNDTGQTPVPQLGARSSRLAVGGSRGACVEGYTQRRNRLLNQSFGFVFQFYHLLPEFDVLENVLLPPIIGCSTAEWMCRRAALHERALGLLERVGLSDRLGHRPQELSGGERQRVAIARALIHEPAVLFADEPTGNLDGKTGHAIFELLQGLNASGQTIVMVTHDRDLASAADEVVHLVDGRIQ